MSLSILTVMKEKLNFMIKPMWLMPSPNVWRAREITQIKSTDGKTWLKKPAEAASKL